ncbi:MAG: ATP-binding cassette domain-containing protein [Fimbriimonadaceae bacterium]|nr:ATP-binding cassette domain-containing protein [Fimbriimonadaceae bacterium]QYK56765.1 MAG: ATP-binding cassette domain-containing protein [Fimbriimonadaceae bacterium]
MGHPNGEGAAAYILFQDVEVAYNEMVTGLRGVSLRVEKGEFVFLCGRTGCGKSTLLKTVTREVEHTAGTVTLAGRDLATVRPAEVPLLRRQMGIVPQDFGLLPTKKVWENLGYAMRAVGKTRREVRQLVPEILERVNLLHRADAFPGQLSGGEQQRVAIGRALINNPPLLLADEPTGNLDPAQSVEITELLLQLNLRGTTVIFATHDMPIVRMVDRRTVTMEQGLIVDDSGATDCASDADPAPVEVENA